MQDSSTDPSDQARYEQARNEVQDRFKGNSHINIPTTGIWQ
jgi:hypothetical protein